MTMGLNLLIVLIALGVGYALISEGLWGATLAFFNVLLSGMIAFNFYEPLTKLLLKYAGDLYGYNDVLCLMGLFLITFSLMRLLTDTMAPTMVRFPAPIYQLGRIVVGLAAGYLTACIILVMFYTAPAHKEFLTIYAYDSKPPFKMGFDRRWLALFQYATGRPFARYSAEDDPKFGHARVFDPYGEWLIRHQNARPYGFETVPSKKNAAAVKSQQQ